MRRTGLILALVVTLGMWGMVPAEPASASQSALPAAMSPTEPLGSLGITSCSSGFPSGSGWTPGEVFRGGWTLACRKCVAKGKAIEFTGRLLAFCHYVPGGQAVQMFTFCQACREGTAEVVPGKL